MKNTIFFSLFSPFLFGQVGINTNSPRATIEIVAKNPTGNHTNIDGIIIPHITRERAQNILNPSESTLFYITEATTGSATDKTIDVLNKGFYYFNGTKWSKFDTTNYRNSLSRNNNNIARMGGDLIENTIINLNNNKLHFVTQPTEGTEHFKIDDGTFNINSISNHIGINTTNPLSNLHIKGDKTDNDFISKVKFESLTTTNNQVTLNNKLTPLYIDTDGNVKNGFNPIAGDDYYTIISSFNVNVNTSQNIFTDITDSSIVTFKFHTNYAFATGYSAIIYGEILFEKREGFKLINYAVTGVNPTPSLPTVTTESVRIYTNLNDLVFDYADGIISVKKVGGSNNMTIYIDGKKLY